MMLRNIKVAQREVDWIVDGSLANICKQNANFVLAPTTSEQLKRSKSQTASRKKSPRVAFLTIRGCTRQESSRRSPTSGATSRAFAFSEYPDKRQGFWIAADSAIDYFLNTYATRYCGAPMEFGIGYYGSKFISDKVPSHIEFIDELHKIIFGNIDNLHLRQRNSKNAT